MSLLNHDNKDFWLLEIFTDDTGISRNTELEAAPDLAEASLICVLT